MIGIIGFGRFGKLMTRYLAQDYEVVVYNRKNIEQDIASAGARAASLKDVCQQDIVILPVPISVFKETLSDIAPLLRPGSLVIDVCSVKEYPVQLMQEILPKDVSILATHPMFGPDSASDALKGCKIVLCNVRTDTDSYQKIVKYLDSKELVIIETTPDEHDKQIAVSLALTHFIGRSLSEFGAESLNIDTEGYQRLLHVLGVVEHDTWQLFVDMNIYNPYAKEYRAAFMEAIKKVNNLLET